MKTHLYLSLIVFFLSSFFNQSFAQLTVGFSVSDTIPCLGETLQFTDLSVNATSWDWDFGDGFTSTLQNPVHTYPNYGGYTVSLTASDGVSSQTATLVVFVETVTAQFSAAPTFGTTCAPLEVSYQNMSFGITSTGSWDTWWDLGNGTIADSNFLNQFAPSYWFTTPGIYSPVMIITSPGGCMDTFVEQDILVDPNPLTTSAVITDIICDSASSGAIDLMVNGAQLPVNYSWSTGANTDDINGLNAGSYIVQISDDNGCFLQDTFIVNPPFFVEMIPDTLACDSVFGSAYVNVSGAIPPVQYLWNTGDTTASISMQVAGGYSVTVYDSAGCGVHKVGFITYDDSCYVDIVGLAFIDYNLNCIPDSGEHGISTLITLNNNLSGTQSQLVTDSSGLIHFTVFPGDYSLVADTGYSPFQPTCQTASGYNFGFLNQDTSQLYFPFAPPSQVDLHLDFVVSPVRPGLPHTYTVKVINQGIATANAVLTMNLDTSITLFPTFGVYDSTAQTITDTLPVILPGQYWQGNVNGYAPATAMPGDTVISFAEVTLSGDVDTSDNSVEVLTEITASFDPNDKQVIPRGIDEPGYIFPGQQLMRYTIRFQNTGTDTAFFVTIRDTIDTDLSLETLVPGASSHPYSLTIENRTLIFSFENILLPDSSINSEGSQGFVSYTISHSEAHDIGTEITNRAAIFFDFNAPVITNTVVNTVTENVGIERLPAFSALIFPNPARDQAVIEIPEGAIKKLRITDLKGRLVFEVGQMREQRILVDVSDIPGGMYFVDIYSGRSRFTGKLIIVD